METEIGERHLVGCNVANGLGRVGSAIEQFDARALQFTTRNQARDSLHRRRPAEGIDLPESTLGDWVGGCSALLSPLVAAVERYVMSGNKVHGTLSWSASRRRWTRESHDGEGAGATRRRCTRSLVEI
ncbi:transposase [Cupriavidus lacunae]|uniref:transposase n=1 Tax=Cupriavidus lacunae TaxID=2666307 RepID=UPI001ABEF525|nr:transposase [Cupriavidus lacunae]